MSPGAPALVFSGGVGHPFAETSAALAAMAGAHGWSADILTDLDAVVARLPDADLLIVNALAWSMTQAEKYAPLRDRWAFAMTDAQMDAILAFHARGGRLLVMHTGTICFDTQPRWKELIGGGWTWGRSHHPPLGPVTVTPTAPGASAFTVVDEAYHALDPAPDCTILATADLGEGPQPLAWTRGDRIAVDALGHDVASLTEPGHRALIDGLLRWLKAA